jgi:RNA-binding protein
MAKLKGSDRGALKKMAHALKPVVHIGAKGLSDGLVENVASALEAHELIKMRFLEHKDQRVDLTNEVATRVGCEVVGVVGNVATLYRRNPDPDKRRIQLPSEA